MDNRVGLPSSVESTCFRYAVIIAIISVFFHSGIELVFHVFSAWLGIYTGYLLNSLYLNKKESR
jgi:hypothetical protein